MPSSPLSRNSRKSSTCAWQAVSPASTQGYGRGSSGATKVSVRGKCSKDSWVSSGGGAPLSQWFLTRVVLDLASSVELIFSGWSKSDVGQVIA